MYYVLKSAEEKREALLGAMETWISGMSAHLKEKGVTPYGYDVINEAIADGSNKVRGLNGVFGSSWNDDSYELCETCRDAVIDFIKSDFVIYGKRKEKKWRWF